MRKHEEREAGKETMVSQGRWSYLRREAAREDREGKVQKREESVFRTCWCNPIHLVSIPTLQVLGSFLPASSLPITKMYRGCCLESVRKWWPLGDEKWGN